MEAITKQQLSYQYQTDGGLWTPSSLWMPSCFCGIKMDNAISSGVAAILCREGSYSWGPASFFFLRVTVQFFPLFVNIMFRTTFDAILLHCFARLAFSRFLPPIDNQADVFFFLIFNGFHAESYFILNVTDLHRFLFLLWKVQVVLSTFYKVKPVIYVLLTLLWTS